MSSSDRRVRRVAGLMMTLALACTGRPAASPSASVAPESGAASSPAGPTPLDELRLLGLVDELASDALGGR